MSLIESTFDPEVKSFWEPTWELSDGTLILGPFIVPPTNLTAYSKINVDGKDWWFAHSGESVSDAFAPEIEAWIRNDVQRRQAEQ